MAAEPTELGNGLRARKKARTRREISNVATRLFMEQGFEAVTLAQIAEAADVSIKTIFNHFGSKEELYFDRVGEIRASIEASIRGRAAGETLIGAMRHLLVDNLVPFRRRGWGLGGEPGEETFRRFLATQDASPALTARRLIIGRELHHQLRAVLADDLGRDERDPAVMALAASLAAVMELRDEVLRTAFAEGRTVRTVRTRVTAVMNEAFDRLDRAFADIDRAA